MRRALVVYESMFGNSADVAAGIARGLELAGLEVECVEVRSAPAVLPKDLVLLVVGGPTHAFGLSRPSTREDAVRQGAPADRASLGLREWLAEVEIDSVVRPALAVFDTRATKVRRLPAAAAASATRIARKRGLRPVVPAMGFLVQDLRGPLEPGEVQRATAWGRTVGESGASRAAAR